MLALGVDIYCFEDKHLRHVADASGSVGYLRELILVNAGIDGGLEVSDLFNEMILLDFRCRVCVLVGCG